MFILIADKHKGASHGKHLNKLHRLINWYNLLLMVFERYIGMSEEEYQSMCYSRAEAAAIVRENARLELERSKVINKARCAASDMKDARELGMTLEEYRAMVL